MKVYKSNIVDALRYLSDLELQRQHWLAPGDNSGYFVDEVETVFLDSGIEDLIAQGYVVFGKKEDSALLGLLSASDTVGYKRDQRLDLHSESMQHVREKAAKALALIEASDGRESTVEILP